MFPKHDLLSRPQGSGNPRRDHNDHETSEVFDVFLYLYRLALLLVVDVQEFLRLHEEVRFSRLDLFDFSVHTVICGTFLLTVS